MTKKSNTDDVILATLENGKNITLKDYERFVKEKNKTAISEMILHRINGRYLRPFTYKDKIFTKEYKNGFSIMANCCLCIEALQSFKNGWGKTPKDENGQKIFDDFFNEYNGLKEFSGEYFYTNIRCGILHQGETTGGWRIKRVGPILENKTINADRFLKQIRDVLKKYTEELKNSEWDSKTWDNCRVKMRKIIENC